MKYFFLGLFMSFAELSIGQTVTLTNTANAALSPDFVSGDTFSLTITGGAANSPVTLVATKDGVADPNNPWTAGTTDGSGNFTITGTETSSYVAEYSQTWSVGGVAVGSPIAFEVIYNPTGSVVVSANITAMSPRCPSGYTYGIEVDIKYQATTTGGTHVTTQSGIPLIPTEFN